VNLRADDLSMLNELLNDHADELTDVETEAFAGMRFDLTAYAGLSSARGPGFHQLTDKQRDWVETVHQRLVTTYENLVSRGLIPRGREVPTPAILQNLPKRPPPMPRSVTPQRASKRHCGRQDEGCYAFVNGDCTCDCCSRSQ
jgi:hypothetical protein